MNIPTCIARFKTGRTARYAHAIVIGGSMAGLLAARVLADHVAQVTIVDRDRFPMEPVFRPGTPQARHGHILLVRGREIIEQLFPGITDELKIAGALTINWCSDRLNFGPEGPALKCNADFWSYACSRPLLEWAIRRRLTNHPRIRFREACRVTDLLFDASGQRVVGALLASRTANGATPAPAQPIYADLVIDASGQRSQAPQWLAKQGYARPAETIIDSQVSYASRTYRLDPDTERRWKSLGVYNLGQGAALFEQEHGTWILTASSISMEPPPNHEAGLLDYLRNLHRPEIYQAIQHARPTSLIYGFRGIANRWRHYERLARLPANFLVTGDAVCTLNPTYGQGMTAAALAALDLDHCLRHGQPGDLARRFQRRLARSLRAPWMTATSADSHVTGKSASQSYMNRLMHAYIEQLYVLTRRNPRIALARYQVIHLIAPPASLFAPSVAGPVLAHWLGSRLLKFRHAFALPGSIAAQKRK